MRHAARPDASSRATVEGSGTWENWMLSIAASSPKNSEPVGSSCAQQRRGQGRGKCETGVLGSNIVALNQHVILAEEWVVVAIINSDRRNRVIGPEPPGHIERTQLDRIPRIGAQQN